MLQILHSASGSVYGDKAPSMVTRNVILSTSRCHSEQSEESGEEGRDNGPRTSQICILLKYRLLQKSIVRGPHFFEGTTNKVILHYVVSQWITKSCCSRSVERLCARGINPSETMLKTHTFPGDPLLTRGRRLCRSRRHILSFRAERGIWYRKPVQLTGMLL